MSKISHWTPESNSPPRRGDELDYSHSSLVTLETVRLFGQDRMKEIEFTDGLILLFHTYCNGNFMFYCASNAEIH